MPATVRISQRGRNLLAQLAREAETTMTEVLDAALESYRRHRLLEQAAAAYASLSADPASAESWRGEIANLDGTVADGLEPHSA
jgi:hypothetical protein